MIKPLISSLMTVMLTGCVSYYYPMPQSTYGYSETRLGVPYEDGYSADEYSYYDTAYYPWWSIDYFYLGRHPYRPYHGNSLSIGFSSGYPYYGPYYYPAYYSDWHAPYYYRSPWFGFNYAWRGYRGYDPYWRSAYRMHAFRAPHRDREHGHDRGHGGYHDNGASGRADGGPTRGGNWRGRDPVNRNIATHPGNRPGRSASRRPIPPVQPDRGALSSSSWKLRDGSMAIVKRGDGKLRPIRPEPISPRGSTVAVTARVAEPRAATGAYPSNQSQVVAPRYYRTSRPDAVRRGVSQNTARVPRTEPARDAAGFRHEEARLVPSPRSLTRPDAQAVTRNSGSGRHPDEGSGHRGDDGRARDSDAVVYRGRGEGHR